MPAPDKLLRFFHTPTAHVKESYIAGVRRWHAQVFVQTKNFTDTALTDDYDYILKNAWRQTHIRCQAAEMLTEDIWNAVPVERRRYFFQLLGQVIDVAFNLKLSRDDAVAQMLSIREELSASLADAVTLVWTTEFEEVSAFDRLYWRDYPDFKKLPMGILYWDDIVPKNNSSQAALETGNQELFPNQQRAFAEMRLLIEAKKAGLKAGGVAPSFHTLVIGPSGSGKTHCVRKVAAAENMGFFEINLSSWLPSGSRASKPTPERIAEFVSSHPTGIIFLDESDKLRPKHGLASDWTRYLIDDVMALLDARVTHWEGWSVELAQKLHRDFCIVLAGAWQDAYTSAFRIHHLLGGDWSNLSVADTFLENNHLPDELLNRISSHVIEVLPPGQEEIYDRLLQVHQDLKIPWDTDNLITVAWEITQGRKGVRGVEEYLITLWLDRRLKESALPLPPADENLEFNF